MTSGHRHAESGACGGESLPRRIAGHLPPIRRFFTRASLKMTLKNSHSLSVNANLKSQNGKTLKEKALGNSILIIKFSK